MKKYISPIAEEVKFLGLNIIMESNDDCSQESTSCDTDWCLADGSVCLSDMSAT